MSYREELVKAMKVLALNDRVLFVGQTVIYPGSLFITETLESIPLSKRLEFPVAEDFQMGFCIGLSMLGYIPCCIYPRFDFLILAMNQLVNHLDKIPSMSLNRFVPKVIVRTIIGSKIPLNPGPQHCQDHTDALKGMLTNVDIVRLEKPRDILPSYARALESGRSTILVEYSILDR